MRPAKASKVQNDLLGVLNLRRGHFDPSSGETLAGYKGDRRQKTGLERDRRGGLNWLEYHRGRPGGQRRHHNIIGYGFNPKNCIHLESLGVWPHGTGGGVGTPRRNAILAVPPPNDGVIGGGGTVGGFPGGNGPPKRGDAGLVEIAMTTV
jgi:hypothetical protein